MYWKLRLFFHFFLAKKESVLVKNRRFMLAVLGVIYIVQKIIRAQFMLLNISHVILFTLTNKKHFNDLMMSQ